MERNTIHKWRCKNCGEMASSFICSHCGKESYNKGIETAEIEKKSDLFENTVVEQKTENNDIVSSLKTSLTKEINSSVIKINGNIFAAQKRTIVSFCLVFILLIAQTFIITIKYNSIKKSSDFLKKTSETLSETVKNQNKKIEKLEEKIDEYTDSQIKYYVHTVKEGETLIEICKEYNIDFISNKKIIYSINGIEKSGNIQVGQKLLLPNLK